MGNDMSRRNRSAFSSAGMQQRGRQLPGSYLRRSWRGGAAVALVRLQQLNGLGHGFFVTAQGHQQGLQRHHLLQGSCQEGLRAQQRHRTQHCYGAPHVVQAYLQHTAHATRSPSALA
jgi:hypothetical protein